MTFLNKNILFRIVLRIFFNDDFFSLVRKFFYSFSISLMIKSFAKKHNFFSSDKNIFAIGTLPPPTSPYMWRNVMANT